jgi:hypothetical protein
MTRHAIYAERFGYVVHIHVGSFVQAVYVGTFTPHIADAATFTTHREAAGYLRRRGLKLWAHGLYVVPVTINA